MAKPTREERRIQKEQAQAAKAAARAAPKAERRARRQRRAEADAQTPATPAARPRLELVTEPGPVKHLHWDAEERACLARAAEAAAQPPQEPAPEPLREEPAGDQGILAGRRHTLYTTEHGNQVVAYERGGHRRLALTEERGGHRLEVPFSEAQVDRVIGANDEAAPLQETVVETREVQDSPRRRGFWRRKAEPASAAPVVEHIYRPVEIVDRLPVAEAEAPPLAQEEPQVAAWEPGPALLEAPRPVRPARPAATPRRAVRAARRPRKAKATLREAPRRPRRKLVRKPARAYPGDNHPVIDIEGIGPVYAKKLEKMGVTTTGLLNVAKPGRVAKKLKVPTKTVRKWQAQAELIKVRGIGPQYAEALARSGIRGIDELKRRDADGIAKQVAKYLRSLDATVVGQPLTPKRIAAWKRKAKPMRRVKVNLERLAVPDHGIPPPWLREDAKRGKAKKVGKKAARKAARRPKKAAKKGTKKARRAAGRKR